MSFEFPNLDDISKIPGECTNAGAPGAEALTALRWAIEEEV